MWGILIAIFVGIWILQLYLSWGQVKHYHKTVKQMSNRSTGYLGTGSVKRKIGIGSVVILVSDENGKIIDGKMMSGVTVFAKFKDFDEVKGKYIQELNHEEYKDAALSVKAAVENIQTQMEKKLANNKEA
ncbi:transcriptional regulator GutM [Gracilibacillus suaedae]|uniref:transcriptional regulator GutM n=1 Tax=Gracilibacillus suaedae TaxID=2820273 RepID=UPI001ABDBE15|nr:transcriptional regulator GutM [Gracilibacillus suaedae]